MNITLKTKDDLLAEGWLEHESGSLFNQSLSPDEGYFSFWFVPLLGKQLNAWKQCGKFYMVESTFMLNNLYIPKVIVKE